MDSRAEEIIFRLGLQPHPLEGGFFRETHRSAESCGESLPGHTRSLATAIYFLLVPETFSELHCLESDEIYHFYCGDPVELVRLQSGGVHDVVTLGPDPLAGHTPQCLVRHGVWQGARMAPGGRYALMGTTMCPGFDAREYRRGKRELLLREWPEMAKWIRRLTRE